MSFGPAEHSMTHEVPRVRCPYPMYIRVPLGRPVPARMRDDLDPCSPPAEYADGSISWDGYQSREARDAGCTEDERQRQADAERARAHWEAQRRKRRKEMWGHIHARECNHANAVEDEQVHGFMGSVAVPPYTDENRMAHGNVVITERCPCGRRRSIAVNGRHAEFGPWTVDEKALDAGVLWEFPEPHE